MGLVGGSKVRPQRGNAAEAGQWPNLPAHSVRCAAPKTRAPPTFSPKSVQSLPPNDSAKSVVRVTDLRDLNAAFAIREKVFVEEQNVPLAEEYDDHDRTDARHYLAHAANGTPAGAARWRETAHGVKLERFAVLADYRNQQIGAILLQQVLHDVQAEFPAAHIYLHAQLRAMPFYARHGFRQVGEMFSECDIQHFKMVLG